MHKNRTTYPLLFLIAIMLGSCWQDNLQQSNNESSLIFNTKLDSVTEDRYAFIKEIFSENTVRFIKADYVDFLTGKEAFEAEKRDKAYYVDGSDTISNITDGYYISNVNDKLRTFRLSEKVSIESIIDDNGPQKLQHPKTLNESLIKKYIDNKILLYLHVEYGVVTRIDERFLP